MNKYSNVLKNSTNIFIIIFITFSLFLFITQSFSDRPYGSACKDCGSIANCLNNNGFTNPVSGYNNCGWYIDTDGRQRCTVSGWCWDSYA